jgi:hypothetical protein
MGRLGPYNNTTAPIACSVRAQTSTFSVLFEVPYSVRHALNTVGAFVGSTFILPFCLCC